MLQSLSEMLQDFPAESPADDQVAWLKAKLADFHDEVMTRVASLETRQEDVERRVAEHELRLGDHSRRLAQLERQMAAARRGEIDVALLDGLDTQGATRH
jgi:predicted  nucleic acid-binding Zn-ribbon protein